MRAFGHPVRGSLALLGIVLLLIQPQWTYGSANADMPLQRGYLDFSHAGNSPDNSAQDPTALMAESKLWWNDGFWWGNLYSVAAGEFRIYRLNWGTQTWEDTGVAIDDREDSRADALWDEANQKLYVASHNYRVNSSQTSNPLFWARLYRYTYEAVTQTYRLDSGFPVTINYDRTEALVLDKDSTGRLWIAFVSRPRGSPLYVYRVYVNATQGDDHIWGEPFALPFPEAIVTRDDIASLIAFRDTTTRKIGVMWGNQTSTAYHFATHADGLEDPEAGWILEASISTPLTADDHINLKVLSTGSSDLLFAAVKTSATSGPDSLVGLLVRDTTGAFSFHAYSNVNANDTTPMAIVDEDMGLVYVFVTGKPGGGKVCYKTVALTQPLSAIRFPPGECGTPLLESRVFNTIHHATTSKHNVNRTTGLVILASDQVHGAVYIHGVRGDPPPVMTARWPGPNMTRVSPQQAVSITFSKAIQVSTLTSRNFRVIGSSGPVAGALKYDPPTRTARFTPYPALQPNTTYTITLTAGIKDISGNGLYGAPEAWRFDTGP